MNHIIPEAKARFSAGGENLRIVLVGMGVAAVMVVLFLRLWAVTVVDGERYVELAQQNQVRQVPVEAPRGAIVDRNGTPIVTNRASWQVVLTVNDVPEDDRQDLYQTLAPVLGLTTNEIRDKVEASTSPLEPVVLLDDVDNNRILFYLEEHKYELPGLDVRQGYRRNYVHASTAAHMVGQVSEVSAEQLETTNTNLKPGDKVGQSGLESQYDEYIRGSDGYKAIEVDAMGVPQECGRGVPATPGNNLRLTIDLGLQQATEKALVDGIRYSRRAGDGGQNAYAGAAVAIDPRNGEVLALASYPTYDPNIFVAGGRDDEIRSVLSNSRTPLSNRAIGGLYPPGSVYKPITSIAAMEEGLLKPKGMLPCPASIKVSDTTFNNWFKQSQGLMDVREALSQSCDTFFYKLALDFYNSPGSPMQRWTKSFGLGVETGIDLPGEAAGLIPTPGWRRETFDGFGRVWTPGHSVNLSIGQGDLLTTPLQMTNVYATIANGGTIHTPRIAQHVEDPGGRPVLEIEPPKAQKMDVDQKHWRPVRDGIYRASNSASGTSTAVFRGFPVDVSGKTGTAEKPPYGDMAWYCAYAPSPNPTIAACAMIENGGHGGTAAAPVVLRMFRHFFDATGGETEVGGSSE